MPSGFAERELRSLEMTLSSCVCRDAVQSRDQPAVSGPAAPQEAAPSTRPKPEGNAPQAAAGPQVEAEVVRTKATGMLVEFFHVKSRDEVRAILTQEIPGSRANLALAVEVWFQIAFKTRGLEQGLFKVWRCFSLQRKLQLLSRKTVECAACSLARVELVEQKWKRRLLCRWSGIRDFRQEPLNPEISGECCRSSSRLSLLRVWCRSLCCWTASQRSWRRSTTRPLTRHLRPSW